MVLRAQAAIVPTRSGTAGWLHWPAVQGPQTDAPWTVRKRAEMRWRAATRSVRTLPDFFVLSGGRCGSTSLFAILCAHPQVMAPSHKEVHFFDRNYERGLDFYRRLFPFEAHRRSRERRLGSKVLTGEATTYYLLHPAVPSRVFAALPQARLIVMLRDPVDRAYSHYQLAVRAGKETLSFEEALDAEEERLAGAEERLATDPSFDSPSHRYHSYVRRGLYLQQLERWEDRFPREQFLILPSESFFADTAGSLARLTAFLGLEPFGGPFPPPRNRAAYEGLRPDTRRRLQERFAEPNRRLEEHLDIDLGWQAPH
jgi:Sulfotransferase domain